MIKPELEFVYEAGGELDPPREIGKVVDGTRRIIPIRTGGYVKGPRITGRLLGNSEVMERLRNGEDVDPAEYYFRTVPEFIAPEGPYDWLNRSIFICTGARYANSIKLWVWRVV